MRLVAKRLLTVPGPEVTVWALPLASEPKRERREEAQLLLLTILSEALGRAPETLELARAEGGKPFLTDGGLQFNLSHSGEVACVATSPAVPVGVDVERVRTFKNEAGMRRRICSAAELAWLQAIDPLAPPAIGLAPVRPESPPAPMHAAEPPEAPALAAASDPDTELIRLWVRKEAVVKASGEGIVRDLNAFSVLDEHVDDGHGGRWRCLDLPSPAPGYVAAVAFPAA